jgi:hypothetical protein
MFILIGGSLTGSGPWTTTGRVVVPFPDYLLARFGVIDEWH